MKRVLFVCSQNRLRSPAAEQVFSGRTDMEVASAGLKNDAEQPVTPELVAWADVIFVMEQTHLRKLRTAFKRHLDRHGSSAPESLTSTRTWTRRSWRFWSHGSRGSSGSRPRGRRVSRWSSWLLILPMLRDLTQAPSDSAEIFRYANLGSG